MKVRQTEFHATKFPAYRSAISYCQPIIRKEYKILTNHLGNPNPQIVATKPGEQETKYDPYHDEGLFLSFAKIDNQKEVIEWVSKNGFLLWGDNQKAQEDYGYFMQEVAKAKQLLSLFNAVVNLDAGGREDLAIRIKIVENPRWDKKLDPIFFNQVRFFLEVDGQLLPKEDFDFNWVDLSLPNEKLLPTLAMRYIGLEVVKKIRDVHFSIFKAEETSPDAVITWRVVPCLRCEDLITMMYLRFYWLITSDKPLKRCKKCGEPFLPDSGKYKYCPNCRKGYPAQDIWKTRHNQHRGRD